MSEQDGFESWWQTLNVYDPTLKALAGSAWMEAIRASKPIPPDPHIALMEAEHDDRMPQIDRALLLWMGEVEDSCRSISVGGMTKCNGCGKPLLPENAWMEDGCPCNSPRGVNSPQPAEDPDKWVIQDRVAPRKSVDELRWSDWPEDIWVTAIVDWPKHKKHGYLSPDHDCILSVRCRRRDLPKVAKPQPQPQKTRVRLFASFGALHIRMPGEITKGIGREVKHDAEGFYVEGGQP